MSIDLEKAKNDIATWAAGFLSQPQSHLNGNSPCPFAHPAIKRATIDFRLGTYDVRADLMRLSESWDDTFEAVVLIYAADIQLTPFLDSVEYGNIHALRPRGLIALEDHPAIREQVGDLVFNQGEYALIIVQAAGKLSSASRVLQDKGYYANWSQQQLDEVVNWRW